MLTELHDPANPGLLRVLAHSILSAMETFHEVNQELGL
ncbi:Unknown protein sequence [Pseudomonas syringae pv. maculicola]|nr:Unknown protein sequence [Pseudomonas syringae pv. maculicola]